MDLERQERGIVTDLIIGGMAAGIIISLLLKYRKKKKTISPVIPPIIIKPTRGQLEIAYYLEMVETTTTTTKVYTIPDFDWIQKIGVHYINSDGHGRPYNRSHSSRRGVRVEIYLQRKPRASGAWVWVNEKTSQITILGNQIDFEVIVKTPGHYLSEPENNEYGDQKYKRSYVGDLNTNYRMGRMMIYLTNEDPPIRNYESKPSNQDDFGDQYTLAFHHKSEE